MSQQEHKNLLILGEPKQLIRESGDTLSDNFRICRDILEGLETATKEKFSLIAVVMQDFPDKLASILKALRKADPHSRLVLLSNMSEEPAAIKMTAAEDNTGKLADDYVICPVEISQLTNPSKVREPDRRHSYPPTTEPVAEKQPAAADAKDKKIQACRKKIKKLEQLVVTDELTGLKNRRYFLEFAKQIINKAREESKQVTILMFDIDNFKHYNDVYGHSAGDDILKQAGILMKRSCRQHDIVARIGGDEFAVIFWELPDKDKAEHPEKERRSRSDHPEEAIFISKRFCRELKDTELDSLGPEGRGVLTISGGLATFPRDGSNIEQLLKQADNALLDAKQSGKNRIYLVGKSENNISNIG